MDTSTCTPLSTGTPAWPTPEPLPDEKATTAIGFLHRARAWFAAHGITRIERIVTDNGACYRADAFTRSLLDAKHIRTKPYTPRHNGKVERYNRILAEELLYARTWSSEQQRSNALAVWNIHYNHHCRVPGLMEALIPRKDESHGSTEEVSRGASGAGDQDGGRSAA